MEKKRNFANTSFAPETQSVQLAPTMRKSHSVLDTITSFCLNIVTIFAVKTLIFRETSVFLTKINIKVCKCNDKTK